MSLLSFSFLLWLLLLGVAIANAAFRVGVLEPRLGMQAAHIISTLMLSAAILIAACLFIGRLKSAPSRAELLAIGLLWVVLTAAFEFFFGHYVMGASWETLLADYNVLKGRLWPLVLLTLLAAPSLAALLCRR